MKQRKLAVLPVLLASTILISSGCVVDEPLTDSRDAAPGLDLRPNEANHLRKELLAMAERDQYIRSLDYDAMSPSERASALRLWEQTDLEHTERLRRVVSVLGWPTRSTVGRDGARAAFLLIQHADADLAFQEACLPLLHEASARGEVSSVSVAFLTDRVLARQGRPQLYGTQYSVRVNDDGVAETDANDHPIYLLPIVEDPERLDERRRAMGLKPWANYEAEMAQEQGRPPAERPRTAVAREP